MQMSRLRGKKAFCWPHYSGTEYVVKFHGGFCGNISEKQTTSIFRIVLRGGEKTARHCNPEDYTLGVTRVIDLNWNCKRIQKNFILQKMYP
jgi:hypothetical protein